MRTAIAVSVLITSEQRERLIRFFGERGAKVVVSHIEDLDQTFGSASTVIRSVMEGYKFSS